MTRIDQRQEPEAVPVWRCVYGNLTREPELRYSASGTAWVSTAIAVSRGHRGDDGGWIDEKADFFELRCFGATAEHLAESAAQGTRVIAFGRLEDDTWTASDGTERHTAKLVADEVGLSLRYASAALTRAERRQPVAPAAPVLVPTGGPEAAHAYEEEPF